MVLPPRAGELPLVHHAAAAALGADRVLARQVLEDHVVFTGMEDDRLRVAGRQPEPGGAKSLPEIRIVCDRSLAARDRRNPPVEPHPVAALPALVGERRIRRADAAAVAREDARCERRTLHERADGLRTLPPVGVDQDARNPHVRPVLAFPILRQERRRQLLEAGRKRRLETLDVGRLGERSLRAAGLKETHALIRVGAVPDDVATERLVPRGDEPEEEPLLNVDKRCHRLVTGRHHASRDVRDPGGERTLVELVARDVVGERRVLILGVERRLAAVDAEVPCVLDRGEFVGVLPLRPCHLRTLVHRRAVLGVERVRLGRPVAVPLAAAAELAVLRPEVVMDRPLVDELRPLALPDRILHAVEQAVRQVVGPDHRDRAEAGDPRPRPREAEDRTVQDLLARGDLRRARRRLVGLRVVDQDEARPDRRPVGPRVLQAADAARDAGHPHARAGRRRARNPWERDLVGRPLDLGRVALVGLALGPLGDPVEASHRVAGLGEVVEERVVVLDLALQAVGHRRGDRLVGTHEDDELPVTVEHRPKAGRLAERRLAAAARHREREQLAAENRALDLGDRGQVVRRPGEREQLAEVRLAEFAEVAAAGGATLGVGDRRKVADLAALRRDLAAGLGDTLLLGLVGLRLLGLGFGHQKPGVIQCFFKAARNGSLPSRFQEGPARPPATSAGVAFCGA